MKSWIPLVYYQVLRMYKYHDEYITTGVVVSCWCAQAGDFRSVSYDGSGTSPAPCPLLLASPARAASKTIFFFAFFFSHPVHHLRLLSRSFLIVTWIDSRGHTYSRLFSPIPPTVRRTCAPCICYRVKGSALSCLADSRTIAGGGITPVFSCLLYTSDAADE